MLLPHKSVIALVDGQAFELFTNSGDEAQPELEAMSAPKLVEHNHGSGGRHYSSAGNPQAHLLEEDAHAAAVTEWLNQQVLAHKIDHLVVIAAPRTLGEMRKHYHGELSSRLVGELSKDLVGQQGPDIVAALRAV